MNTKQKGKKKISDIEKLVKSSNVVYRDVYYTMVYLLWLSF